MSVWVGSPMGRYTDEFRHLIYEINPNYLPCVYKEMFETNATNSLRDLEDGEFDDQETIPYSKTGNLKSIGKSRAITSAPQTRCSSAVSEGKSKQTPCKQNAVSGWEICTQAHSATSVHCITTSDESTRLRSRSASAKLNTARSDAGPKQGTTKNGTMSPSTQTTPKKVKPRNDGPPAPPVQSAVIKGKIKHLLDRKTGWVGESGKDLNSKSSFEPLKPSGQMLNIAGYLTSNPIKYPFIHFDYTENYIELYRQEYTLRKIEEFAVKVQSTCTCGRAPGPVVSTVPCVPVMPVFYATEDCSKLRLTNSFHTDARAIKTRREITMKKKSAITSQEVEQMKTQQGRKVLPNSSVIKIDFYTNPLTISKTRPLVKSSAPSFGHSAPSIPHKTYQSNACCHPNSASSTSRDGGNKN